VAWPGWVAGGRGQGQSGQPSAQSDREVMQTTSADNARKRDESISKRVFRSLRRVDTATACICGLAGLELFLAMRMSLLRAEQMRFARGDRTKAVAFLKSARFQSWQRAQLNNTEYAPMLGLLMLLLRPTPRKWESDTAEGEAPRASALDRVACLGALAFSCLFCYAAATQGRLKGVPKGPGQGGMSPLRPVGAMGRYASMVLLIVQALRRRMRAST
jgi:hypothetical protein